MKNTLRSGILLGMGLLCAGTFVATSQPASAAPDRPGDNRWDDRRDDNNRGRDGDRDRRNDRDDDRDRRNDRDNNRWNDRDGRGNGRGPNWNNGGPGPRRNDNDWRYNNGRWDDHDWRDNDYRGNDYRGNDYRGNYGNNGGWGNNQSRSTIEGVVVQDLSGNDFVIRTNNGRQIRVVARNGESRRISRGDIVRVYGTSYNGTFNAQSVTIIRNR